MAKLTSKAAYLRLYNVPNPGPKRVMYGKPRPWHRCACGYLTQPAPDGGHTVRDRETRLRATADTVPQAIGALRDLIRQHHDAQFAWKR